jgi:hypothetical protein
VLTRAAERIIELIETYTSITPLEADQYLDSQTRYALRESQRRPTNLAPVVTPRARADYAEAYGIEPIEQKSMENRYGALTLGQINPANAEDVLPDSGITHGYDTAVDVHDLWNFPEAVCNARFSRLGRPPNPTRAFLLLLPLTLAAWRMVPSPERWLLYQLHPALSLSLTMYTAIVFWRKLPMNKPKRRSRRTKRYACVVSSGTGKSYIAKRNYDVVDDDSLYRHRLPASECEKCLTRKFKPLSKRQYRFTDPHSPWGVYLTRKWTYQKEALNGKSERMVLVHGAAQAKFLGLKVLCAFYLSDRDIERVARTNNRHSLVGMYAGRRHVITEPGSHPRVCIPYGTLDSAIREYATWLPPTPTKFGL